MTGQLAQLTNDDLRILVAALRSGRLAPPFTPAAVQRLITAGAAAAVAEEFAAFVAHGFSPAQMAVALDLVVQDRIERSHPSDVVDLVTTGPDAGIVANRDTAVVVRELFANATESVLVAGYAVYQGQRVFQALADRMQQVPELRVSLFLDIQRAPGDTSTANEIVRRFAERFRRQQWPQDRPMPTLFYDPRSLDTAQDKRACLHAKCVVVDERRVFVSSANFTEAAQQRNIEVGLLLDSAISAQQIAAFFRGLVSHRLLIPVG